MTEGMKSGPGDDPFASPDASDTSSAEIDGDDRSRTDVDEPTEEPVEIPWYQDRLRVSDDRPNATQFELREDTFEDLQGGPTSAVDRLARKVGLDPDDSRFYVTDAREAILRAGMQNLDDAAAELRDWGYGRIE